MEGTYGINRRPLLPVTDEVSNIRCVFFTRICISYIAGDGMRGWGQGVYKERKTVQTGT